MQAPRTTDPSTLTGRPNTSALITRGRAPVSMAAPSRDAVSRPLG